MPRPSSRRAASKPPAPEPEVELPEEDAGDAGEPAPRASQRGAAARSGRRSDRRSGQQSAPKAAVAKHELTDEERSARRSAIVYGLKLGGGIALLFVAAFAAWWFLLRTDEKVQKATAQLNEAMAYMQVVEASIDRTQPAAALKAWTEGDRILTNSPELGFAAESPSPEAPELASLALARRAYELKLKLGELKVRIDRITRDQRAQDNLVAIDTRLGKLLEVAEADLEKIEQDAIKFMDNPVEPGAGRNEEYVKDYADLVTRIRFQMQKLANERQRRLRARTEDPVVTVQAAVEELVKKELFLEALSKVDEAARQNPDAKFDAVRTYVEESGNKAWETAKSYVATRYTDYAAPGTADTVRQRALKEAQDRLKEVIDRFGVTRYLDEAKQLLAKYPAAP